MKESEIHIFQSKIWEFYEKNKRVFPWRETHNPYHILVSELMLQQTQTDRVVPKYLAFIEAFPTIVDLSQAPLSEVLRLWSGLGYNRRAKFLHTAAAKVISDFHGKIPSDGKDLVSLPGIGPYTAGAIQAFAYEIPTSFIETNIRRVFIHEFFGDQDIVRDKEILSSIQKTLPERDIRDWYYALMDYGAHLGKTIPNPNKKSKGYAIQSQFKGSRREIRGKLIKLSLIGPIHTNHPELIVFDSDTLYSVFQDLVAEGLISSELIREN